MNSDKRIVALGFSLVFLSSAALASHELGHDETARLGLKGLQQRVIDLEVEVANIQLIPGPQGPQGEQGPQGPVGPTVQVDCVAGTGFKEDGCGVAPPVIADFAIDPASPFVGDTVSLFIEEFDPDNDPVSSCGQFITINSQLVQLPPLSTAALIPAIGSTPAFIPDQPGEYVVRVTATDSTGRSATSEFSIAVSNLP